MNNLSNFISHFVILASLLCAWFLPICSVTIRDKYENEKMVELYSGINATVLKANSLKQRLIKPTQAIKLMQEFELKNIKTIDMKTLDNYQGYAFVLETEGIFIPLEIENTTIIIQAKLKYGGQMFESNKIKLNINFKN